jgi:hypothetical protein
MFTFLSVLVIAGTAIYIWSRVEPRLDRVLELRAKEILKPMLEDEEPLPAGFVEWAQNESTEWARDDKLKRMRELYGRLKNWDKVRTVLMAEEEEALRSTF